MAHRGSPVEQFLKRLIEHRAKYAAEILRAPTDKTEFGFGHASGTYHGLLIAEQLLNQLIEEEKNDGNDK